MHNSSNILAGLTAKQAKALPLLAIGETAKDVSRKIKVSQTQLSHWRRDAKFMAALEMLRKNIHEEAQAALQSLSLEAVLTLRDILQNTSSDHIRLRAAMYIIDQLEIMPNTYQTQSNEPDGINIPMLYRALGVGES